MVLYTARREPLESFIRHRQKIQVLGTSVNLRDSGKKNFSLRLLVSNNILLGTKGLREKFFLADQTGVWIIERTTKTFNRNLFPEPLTAIVFRWVDSH